MSDRKHLETSSASLYNGGFKQYLQVYNITIKTLAPDNHQSLFNQTFQQVTES